MMFGLYFLTCLADNPGHCVMRKHLFDEAVSTPMHCLVVAQPQMAEWQRTHERWRVERFRCGKPPKGDGTLI